MRITGRVRAVAAFFALILATGPLSAQSDLGPNEGFGDRPRIGIGYVSNAPNMFQGISAYVLTDFLGGVGLYVDYKRSASSPRDEADFIDSLTVADVEELPGHFQDFDGFEWWSSNVALVRPITPELMLYLGAGLTSEDVFWRYVSEDSEMGTFGRYWVADPAASGNHVNILGGAFLRMTRHIALQFGLESRPSGFTVGASYSFPIRR